VFGRRDRRGHLLASLDVSPHRFQTPNGTQSSLSDRSRPICRNCGRQPRASAKRYRPDIVFTRRRQQWETRVGKALNPKTKDLVLRQCFPMTA
jgi:hypothetical protein